MDKKSIVNTALERFKLSEEAFGPFRKRAQEDLKFCAEDQWEPLARQARETSGRPCMQIDRINPSIRQIVNESRQNRPSIQIDPVSDGADVDTAKIFAGLIRHIEYDSSADIAYDIASEYAVKTGMGYFRLVPEYESDKSFDMKLCIKAVADPSTVFLDPFHKEMDGSDCEWGFVVEDMSHGDFTRAYPKSETTAAAKGAGGWSAVASPLAGWVTENSVRVAEYFYREYTPKKIYQLQSSDGTKSVQYASPMIEEALDRGDMIKLNERDTEILQVKWLKLAGEEILEETSWPCSYIPIFPVKGEEFWVAGERFICGAVRRARDAQRALNYLRSAQIEAVDLAPKAPFIGAAGQFDTFESDWRDANRKNLGYLEYNPVDVSGNPAPPPQRSSVEPAIQAIMATGSTAADDLKAIFGIFDASLGNQGNETSGVAIKARKEQSSNSNFHYYDNLVRAIKHLGRTLIQVIPTYYDTERTVRIVKPNGEQELQIINGMNEKGKSVDFSAGKYDVIVKTGPTYQTKRQEMVDQSIGIINAYPQAGPLIADLVVGSMDFDGAQEIAARLRSQVPPDVLQATGEDDSGDPAERAAALQVANQQMKKSLESLNAYAMELEKQMKLKEEELKLTKMEQKADTTEATMRYNIEAQKLALEEATRELEFTVKQQEFYLQKEQLELQKIQMEIGLQQQQEKIDLEKDKAELDYLKMSAEKTIGTVSDIKPLTLIDIPMDATLSDADLGGKIGYDTL